MSAEASCFHGLFLHHALLPLRDIVLCVLWTVLLWHSIFITYLNVVIWLWIVYIGYFFNIWLRLILLLLSSFSSYLPVTPAWPVSSKTNVDSEIRLNYNLNCNCWTRLEALIFKNRKHIRQLISCLCFINTPTLLAEMKYKTTFDIFNNLFIGINDDFVFLHITFNQDNHWFKIHWKLSEKIFSTINN